MTIDDALHYTPEQRAAMYGWYAYDPRMRSNIGIRRRLAPLLDNSRAELEAWMGSRDPVRQVASGWWGDLVPPATKRAK